LRPAPRVELPEMEDWPQWPVTWKAQDDDLSDPEPLPLPPQASPKGRWRGQPQADSTAERLRQKLSQRKKNERGKAKAEKATDADSGVASVIDAEFADIQKPSDSDMCVLCLETEAELGRTFPFVLEKCGHKCICRACLRKLKAQQKRVEVECPLCRVKSKPVHRDRYAGVVYTAGDS